jgi:hypothetical protein
MAVMAVRRGQTRADLISFGSTKENIAGEGLLPVAVGPGMITGGLVHAGQAVVRAGLLVNAAGLAG